MPEDLSKKIERPNIAPRPELKDSDSFESEYSERRVEDSLEDFDQGSEGKKSLESQGEAIQKISKAQKVLTDEEVERGKKIEEILSEGLNDVYLSMSPQKQSEFKRGGEEAMVKINKVLSKTKFSVEKIINIIKDWLKIIPGVNRFFLEQEAKIKTDRILKLKK
ncbi:MAG: hypothetical protein WC280_00780 [Patescibacteria group bacterium]